MTQTISTADDVEGNPTFQRESGEFLITKRWFEKPFTGDHLTYVVLKVVPPAEFLEKLDRNSTGRIDADTMSGWLVNAFDSDLQVQFGIDDGALFAYKMADGKLIWQHST